MVKKSADRHVSKRFSRRTHRRLHPRHQFVLLAEGKNERIRTSPPHPRSWAHLLFANLEDPGDAGLNWYFRFVNQFDRSFTLAEAGET